MERERTPDEDEQLPGDEEQESAAPPEESASETPDNGDGADQQSLSQEELDRLATDPELVNRVLQGEEGQKVLDRLLNTVLADPETLAPHVEKAIESREEQKKAEATAEEEQRILAEAVEAAENGDPSKLGELALRRIQKDKLETPIRDQVRAEVETEAESSFRRSMDRAIVRNGLSEAANALTDTEKSTIIRSNFNSNEDWVDAVFAKLHQKNAELRQPELSEANKAEKNRGTSARANNVRTPALVGGSAGKQDDGMSAREWMLSGGKDDDD